MVENLNNRRVFVLSYIVIIFVLLSTMLFGCVNMAEYAKAIANDNANVCIAVSTPYGGGVIGRANTPGSKLNMSGGQCNIETAK